MKLFIPTVMLCLAGTMLAACGAQTNALPAAEAPRPVRLSEVRLRDCCVWPDTNTHTYYLVSSTGRRGTNGRPAVVEYTSKNLETWEGPRVIFEVPPDVLENAPELVTWAQRAITIAARTKKHQSRPAQNRGRGKQGETRIRATHPDPELRASTRREAERGAVQCAGSKGVT